MRFFGYISNNECALKICSSGAAFFDIASSFIENGGAVYGAAYDYEDSCKVVHKRIESKTDIPLLCGSKYSFSDFSSENIYSKLRDDFVHKKRVLFVGTPCQIIGVSTLAKSLGAQDLLFTASVVCHGAGDPIMFKAYIDELERSHGHLNSINLRDKKTGWKKYGVSLSGEIGSASIERDSDHYLPLFISNYLLLPKCFSCKAKSSSPSDIVLGDFWGVESYFPDIDYGNGISIVLGCNEKGEAICKLLENRGSIHNLNNDQQTVDAYFSRHNPAFAHNPTVPDNFDDVRKIYLSKGPKKAFLLYKRRLLISKLRGRIARIFRK